MRSSLSVPAGVCGRLSYVLCFAVPFLVLALYWSCFIRPAYFPSRDEIALLVNSACMFHPSAASWFLEGYSRYFVGYPGLSQHATDFIRPVANAVYFLSSLAFGTRWAWYLLVPYAVQAGIVCLAVKLAVEAATLPLRRALLVGIAVFLSPAFAWEQVYFASFGLDLLGALLTLGALHQLWHRRYLSAWLLMLLGVFTKETTLFAPVVTVVLVWLLPEGSSSVSRRIRLSLLWLMPVFIWAAVRALAFHGHAGIYALKAGGLGGQAANVLHGFLAWPFGTRTVRQSVRFRLLFFPLNALFWVSFLALTVPAWLKRHGERTAALGEALEASSATDRAAVPLLLYTSGALAMPLLLNLPQRFGASFYPLFFLLLTRTWHAASRSRIRAWAAACLALSILAAVYQKHIEPTSLRDAQDGWTLARSYVQQVHASRAPYLLVVHDASGGFTSPSLIARFAGYPGTLVRADNLEGIVFARCAGQPAVTQQRSGDRLWVRSAVSPECGFYAFDSVPPQALTVSGSGVTPYNDGMLTLLASLPSLRPLPPQGTPEMFGEMTVEAQWHGTAPALLVPVLGELRYRELP